MLLEISNIQKTYENELLLKEVSFSVDSGEIVCLLGRSGSGKSTLLRIIAGLEAAEKGNVFWMGKDISSLAVHQRGFGLMFQDYALFPHRTVEQNVAFGLCMQNLNKENIQQRTREMLSLVHMSNFASRKVTDLSGGEQQRIALARMLAPQPKLLMLDEPMGALDKTLKQNLLDELRDIIHKTHIPAIYVTHDQEEAYSIADRLVLLNNGRIEQIGSPEDIFRRPISAWVAGFLGLGNLIPAEIISGSEQKIRTGLGELILLFQDQQLVDGEKVQLLIRPDTPGMKYFHSQQDISSKPGSFTIRGEIQESVFNNGNYRIMIRVNQNNLSFISPIRCSIGEILSIQIPAEGFQCLK